MKHVFTLAAALVAMLPFTASAQSLPTPTSSPPPVARVEPTPDTQGMRIVREHGRTVYVLPTGIVHGEVQRPYAFAVSGRSPLGYTHLDDTKSFVPAVVATVRRDPF
jgi:hypothetical protein